MPSRQFIARIPAATRRYLSILAGDSREQALDLERLYVDTDRLTTLKEPKNRSSAVCHGCHLRATAESCRRL